MRLIGMGIDITDSSTDCINKQLEQQCS